MELRQFYFRILQPLGANEREARARYGQLCSLPMIVAVN